ncbi:MAG: FAD-dependent oxidoreductase [Mycobacterium sp.]|uniref:FAD-dependent oxidoreductase n=1 Tax=Mycobacterium sp. TaxID=1785 RepID=UPI003CC52608
MDDTEVLIVGAGLAGLRCAAVLASAGRDVAVWEAGEAVGGRVRTDAIDGFRCDRGFQVLNPAYPELGRAVDVSALHLRHFGAGVVVRRDKGTARYVHPLHHPGRLILMLAKAKVGPRELLALSRWAAPALRPKALKSAHRPDLSLAEALEHAGVRGEARRVIDRFLAGVLLDDTGSSSNAFALLLTRTFALGVPALPADGMQALPLLLAADLNDRISLCRRVTRIGRDGAGWRVSDGDREVRARHVVVATDPTAAAVLTNEAAPQMHSVVTDWWTCDQPPPQDCMLWIDGRAPAQGPVLNVAVISAVAPTYAPPGRHLVAASALPRHEGTAPSETVMRRHTADILGVDAGGWELVTRHVIREALPAQLPPLKVRRPVRTPAGIWLCGDHRDTASIQGALVSGRRTAGELLRIG